jgi:hypothetical protein
MEPPTAELNCVRCHSRLEFLESGHLLKGSGGWNPPTPMGFPNSDPFDFFACSKCGRVEMFLATRGRSSRGMRPLKSASRAVGRVVGKLMRRQRT